MRALIFALCLLATPALADVVGVVSVVDGAVIAEEGSTVEINGMVDGVVRNNGASVSIWGMVDAVSDRQPGITIVHPGAVVRQRTE